MGADDCEKGLFVPFCCGGFAEASVDWPNWYAVPFDCWGWLAVKLKLVDVNGFAACALNGLACGWTAGESLRPRSEPARAFGFNSFLLASCAAVACVGLSAPSMSAPDAPP